MKKGRDFMKRKRLLSAMLAGIFAVSMLGGCASAVPQGATETTQGGAQETDRTSGTVKLRVWAEESTYDALNKMIDSFKEEYKGQATFDITLEQNADSDTRDNVLGDVHNAADVFIPCLFWKFCDCDSTRSGTTLFSCTSGSNCGCNDT